MLLIRVGVLTSKRQIAISMRMVAGSNKSVLNI